MFKLITDGKLLSKEIAATGQLYKSAHDRLHVAAVSAIAYAARTGQVGPINQLYGFLKSNDQTALKLYIRRAHAIIGLGGDTPDGKDKEVVQAAIDAGTVLSFADKQFGIKRGHNTAEAKMLAKLSAERFINPDGKKDFGVFDRNVLSEVQTLSDTEVLKRFIEMVKQMDAGDTERRKVIVSEKVKKLFRPLAGQAETMLHQMQAMSDDRKAPTQTTPKAKATAKPKASKKTIVAAKADTATTPVQTVN